MNHEEVENVTRAIKNELEAVIKVSHLNRTPEVYGFTAEFYKTFKEKVTP